MRIQLSEKNHIKTFFVIWDTKASHQLITPLVDTVIM